MARDRTKDIEILDMPWPIAVLAALSALFVFGVCAARIVYKPFRQPAASMEPAIPKGGYAFVDKFAYAGSKSPQRGDIIVFRPGTHPDLHFVKRVVAVGGDRVQMRGGLLYVNDRQMTSAEPREATFYVEPDDPVAVEAADEVLSDGKPYQVLSFDMLPGDDTQQYEVPKNHYFVLGDNRDNSSDSRYEMGGFGYVAEASVLGKVTFVLAPSTHVASCAIASGQHWCVER